MHSDGTCVQRVTSPDEQCRVGRISPDSESIAFRTVNGSPIGIVPRFSKNKDRVNTMKLDGTGRNEVVREDPNGFPDAVCWSPDGKSLAVEINRWKEVPGGLSIPSEAWIEIYDLEGKRLRTIKPPKYGNISHSPPDWR
jgi:Tol biopolymer transport system component